MAACKRNGRIVIVVCWQAAAFIREASDTLGRRDRQADTTVWLDSKLYPQYYRSTFHYQVRLLHTRCAHLRSKLCGIPHGVQHEPLVLATYPRASYLLLTAD